MNVKLKERLRDRRRGAVTENILVFMIALALTTAFLIIVFSVFSTINDKWQMRQSARQYMLIMETEGYLNDTDAAALTAELSARGLKNISLNGTTRTEAPYGSVIVLHINGTYDYSVFSFGSDAVRTSTTRSSPVEINLKSTAKQ